MECGGERHYALQVFVVAALIQCTCYVVNLAAQCAYALQRAFHAVNVGGALREWREKLLEARADVAASFHELQHRDSQRARCGRQTIDGADVVLVGFATGRSLNCLLQLTRRVLHCASDEIHIVRHCLLVVECDGLHVVASGPHYAKHRRAFHGRGAANDLVHEMHRAVDHLGKGGGNNS
eukprot:Mycagemm_TRINITY_DN10287_c1_g1::TRINITY_DN10287_c1_g1_i1::g.3692::m.3692 type:complete len:180 gc:universal TRINITY_DN10287_c1_g1_i1:949-410(-)